MSEVVIGSPEINQIVIQEEENSVVITSETTAIATIIAQGPQGAIGPQGPQGPTGSGVVVDGAAKVDKSVVYYDLATASFKADATWVISSITDGGNF